MNPNKLLELYDSKELDVKKCLDKTNTQYRTLDPGSYLYRKVLEYKYEDKFSHDFIELVYVTLSAWNMNSRAAKLSDFPVFEESIKKEKKSFDKLRGRNLKELSDNDFDVLETLFFNLKLVASKTPLVTFSKTMHFFLSDTVGPIDRKYTIQFYKGNTNIPDKIENQFKLYKQIHEGYRNFAQKVGLSSYIQNDDWDRTEPKIVDNIIIGYQKIEDGVSYGN